MAKLTDPGGDGAKSAIRYHRIHGDERAVRGSSNEMEPGIAPSHEAATTWHAGLMVHVNDLNRVKRPIYAQQPHHRSARFGRTNSDPAELFISVKVNVVAGKLSIPLSSTAMESFFSLLQKKVLDRERWATRQQLRLAITWWIERTYHRRRRQRALGRLTPIEYETLARDDQHGHLSH